jgi:DNA processing protein
VVDFRAGMTRLGGGVDYVVRTAAQVLGSLNDVERKHAPSQLFLVGDETLLSRGPRVSVVGSRQASAEGLRRAQVLARALVRHEMIVVSGLAAGIDAAAHRAAIDAGGRTIAVLGTPVDVAYPAENRELQDEIAREHLLVSQFAPGSTTTRASFPQRNRTMALLTDATVIVEAGEKSGTVHQGWEALRLGRHLFLLEHLASDPALSWPREMIHYGAQVLTRANLEDVLSAVPAMTASVSDRFADYV